MGRLDRIKQFNQEHNKFEGIDLNEGNVQAIFNRCLAKDDTPKEDISRSILFSRTLGYKAEDEIVFNFDKQKLIANKKKILYLYGQLKSVHQGKNALRLDDAPYNYADGKWTDTKAHLLEFLYLGCTYETGLLAPFNAETNSDSLVLSKLKPTLSPKDPAFPAWWEAHRGEWED